MMTPRRKQRVSLGRRLGIALTWSSLALAIATIVLWIVSYWNIHMVFLRWEDWPATNTSRQRGPGVRMVQGYVFVSWSHIEFYMDHPERIAHGWDTERAERFRRENLGGLDWHYSVHEVPGEAQVRAYEAAFPGTTITFDMRMGIESHGGFGYNHTARSNPSRTDRWTWYMFPAWLLVALLSVPPAARAIVVLRRRHRIKRGCCPRCGYDLRGNPTTERCPECGDVQ